MILLSSLGCKNERGKILVHAHQTWHCEDCYEAKYISQFDSQKLTSQLLVEWTVADEPELQKTMGG